MDEPREIAPEELLYRGYLPRHDSCSVVCLVQFPLQETYLVGALLAYQPRLSRGLLAEHAGKFVLIVFNEVIIAHCVYD